MAAAAAAAISHSHLYAQGWPAAQRRTEASAFSLEVSAKARVVLALLEQVCCAVLCCAVICNAMCCAVIEM